MTASTFQVIGLATAVSAVVVRPLLEIQTDGAVPGEIATGRGGMICNTLAVASGLGVATAGIIACGSDSAGSHLRDIISAECVTASFIQTAQTPVTVTLAVGATRSSIMGVAGDRERDLTPDAVATAWSQLESKPVWGVLTLPALDSPAGQTFAALVKGNGGHLACTLSSSSHVLEHLETVDSLLAGVDLVFGNHDEVAALQRSSAQPHLLICTNGERGATAFLPGGTSTLIPVTSPVSVIDTTGAGDAFAGGVLATLDPRDIDEHSVTKSVLAGHRAAGLIIARLGAAPGANGMVELAHLGKELGITRY
jgi:ribokinase